MTFAAGDTVKIRGSGELAIVAYYKAPNVSLHKVHHDEKIEWPIGVGVGQLLETEDGKRDVQQTGYIRASEGNTEEKDGRIVHDDLEHELIVHEADCELVKFATPEERLEVLRHHANRPQEHDYDLRPRICADTLYYLEQHPAIEDKIRLESQKITEPPATSPEAPEAPEDQPTKDKLEE